MSETHVTFQPGGLPETILSPEPPEALQALDAAMALGTREQQREGVAAVLRRWPVFLDAWSRLGELARDDVEAYACFRVAYHRGLDRLRQSGWRGSGFVRWSHESNHGFLRGLNGLRLASEAIGDHDEARRCSEFLSQLDPTGTPR